jgi:4-aminobutyrate aminotransferase/(S)-3-amino-2-methylpropionate transaminase
MPRSVVLRTEIPGPRSQELFARAQEHTPLSVGHVTPVAIARAEGALVTDVDGNTFIDFAGGIGALNVGHRHPAVVQAIKEQCDQYLHTCFMVLNYEPYVELARTLNQITPGSFAKKTLFFNSGSEAIENVIKIARAYTRRLGVLAFTRAFHGRTITALSLTGQNKPYKTGFGPLAPEIYRVPVPYVYRCPHGPQYPCCPTHTAQVLEEIFRSYVCPENVAAFIAEPVLGEGGFIIPPREYFREIVPLLREHGILFIADEVQTGFGRTGKMFAIEHYGVEPDLIVTAKSLAGGMPLAAVTGRKEIMDALAVGSMGGTYGGHPASCRAALATIEVLQREGLLARAEAIGRRTLERFHQMKERYPLVGDVRGLGAMCALELVKDPQTREPATEETLALLAECLRRGLLLMKAGAGSNVVRTLMPLVITDDQLEEALDILEESLQVVSRRAAAVTA